MRELIRALAPFSALPVPSEAPRESRVGLAPASSQPGWERATSPTQTELSGVSGSQLGTQPPTGRSRSLAFGLLGLLACAALGAGAWLASPKAGPRQVLETASHPTPQNPTPHNPQALEPTSATHATALAESAKPAAEAAPSPSAVAVASTAHTPAPSRGAARPRSVAPSAAAAQHGAAATPEPAPKPAAPARAWDNDSPLPPP
ncbi:MAG: hypothetical protein QM756_33570 [Polyangiaceae bacterium]